MAQFALKVLERERSLQFKEELSWPKFPLFHSYVLFLPLTGSVFVSDKNTSVVSPL